MAFASLSVNRSYTDSEEKHKIIHAIKLIVVQHLDIIFSTQRFVLAQLHLPHLIVTKQSFLEMYLVLRSTLVKVLR